MFKNNPYIIAEIGQAHDGSLGIAHSFIDALSNSGIDAIKFQTHIASAESSIDEPFRINFSYEDKTRYEYWKRMEFTIEQWVGLKKHCEDKSIDFISSPFSLKAVDLLKKIDTKIYKIGSGEVSNLLMLKKIMDTNKTIILSSGLSSMLDLDKTINYIFERTNKLSLLQCTTAYPTKPENWGLNCIQELKKRYDIPIGFSDHSGNIYSCLAATTLGAEILEFHVTFDKQMFGPDSTSSLNISEVKNMIKGIREIKSAIDNPIIKTGDNYLKKIFEKSLSINKDCKKGHVICENDLETKKPSGCGIDSKNYKEVIGKTTNKNLKEGDFINYIDLNE